MLSFQEQIEEFEAIVSAVIDEEVIELSKTFDLLYTKKDSASILTTIESAITMMSNHYNTPTKMQISYNIANGYHDLRIIEKSDNESYFEKEIYYLRYTLNMYESSFSDNDDNDDNDEIVPEVAAARYIAMRSYTNLGNAFRGLCRYIAAIDCFQNALSISNNFAMASLNLSLLLFQYAQVQIKPYEQSYYHHACIRYYEQTKKI